MTARVAAKGTKMMTTTEERERLGRVVLDEVAKVWMAEGISHTRWEQMTEREREVFRSVAEAVANAATAGLQAEVERLRSRNLSLASELKHCRESGGA